MENWMTEQNLIFVEECEKETNEQFNKFLNDKEFIDARIKELVDVMIQTTKKSNELEDSGATPEEIKKTQKAFLDGMADNQLNSLKTVYDDLATSRYDRVKVLAQLSFEEFKEVSFELTKRELGIMTNFSQELLARSEKPIMDALNKLDEEEFEEYKKTIESDKDNVEVPIFNIDQTKTVN